MDKYKTDSKSRTTREIHPVKKSKSFMIMHESEISAVRASGVRRLFVAGAY